MNDNLTAHKASDYDQKIRQTIPFYEHLHTEAIGLVKATHPDPRCWIDTGCGTGLFAQRALAAFPNTRFILADPAEAMLVQARDRLRPDNPRLTILPAADSAKLISKLESAAADVITAIQCHHYLQGEARKQAVQACFDLLASGGLFVAYENVAPATSEGTRIGLARWRAFQLAQGRPQHEVETHLSRYGTEFFPITVQQHLALLKQTGFRTVELFWFSHMQAGVYGIK